MKIIISTNDGVVIGQVYDEPGQHRHPVWIDTIVANDEIVAESDVDMFGSSARNVFAEIIEQARRIEASS